MSQMKSDTGFTVTNRDDILQIATKYYQTLYSQQCQTNEAEANANEDPVPPFMEREVELSISKLKQDKSPGPDGISNEIILAGKDILVKPLKILFNMILRTKKLPTQWTYSEITLIYKKGDAKQISNYRPISLTSCLYKVFSTTLLRRITKTIDEGQGIEQSGFIKGFSTIDHIHTLNNIIEKYKEYGKVLYIGYVDYSKAFDSLSHAAIWRALAEQGISKGYIDIIKELYHKSTSSIRLDRVGPPFRLERGVRQGDPLSSKLFISVLESIFRALSWDNIGIRIDGKYLSHLRFADDIVLLSDSSDGLQYMLETLNSQSVKVGLQINREKTKVMTNSEKKNIQIEEVDIEYVDEYIYLGQLISFENSSDKEINRRVTNTWKKYWSMKEIFKGNLPTIMKTKALETCLLPCLTYASQTWPLSIRAIKKIRTCQRGLERSLVGLKLKDRVKSSEIRRVTKARDAVLQILRLKWRWAGHIQRYKDERWTRIVTNWWPLNWRRRPGRPFKRWDDDIAKVAGKTWSTLARDRCKWKAMEEAFTATGGPYTEY